MKNTLKKIITLSLAASILILTGCQKGDAKTKTDLDYVMDKKELIVGLDDSFPPMGFRDKDSGEIVGFDIDLANELGKRWGVTIKLQPMDWGQKDNELKSKNIDVIWNGFSKTPEREKEYSLSIPYLDNIQTLVVRADSNISSLADLEGKTLAIQANSSSEDALEQNPDLKSSLNGDPIRVPDNVKGILEVKTKNADALLVDSVVANFMIKDDSDLSLLDSVLTNESFVIGCRKDDVKLAEKINETLKEMAEDKTFDTISQKWFGKDLSKTVLGK